MNLTIARALNTFGIAVVAGCLIIAAAATFSLQQLRVGGAAYSNMIAGKDLVADVLPREMFSADNLRSLELQAAQVIFFLASTLPCTALTIKPLSVRRVLFYNGCLRHWP